MRKPIKDNVVKGGAEEMQTQYISEMIFYCN